MTETAQRFIEALNALESSHEDAALVELFSDECMIGNVAMSDDLHGKDGARQFWKTYRESFGEVRSSFVNIMGSDTAVALEWKTEGTMKDGAEIFYAGVSILEVKGGKIWRFQAFFDPTKLTQPVKV